MDPKRLTEWLGTAEGLAKAAVAFIGVPGVLWVGTRDALAFLSPNAWVSRGVAMALVVAVGSLLWRSFRRFAEASRVERPDAFTLRPQGPESLIGRTEDLDQLVKTVKRNRLTLLDGESGCGKSALVSAGLIPVLQRSDGLLPVTISDWGDDWERGPFSAALEALFNALSSAERERLKWTASPDLAADTPQLAANLALQLRAVVEILDRRPLVVADQFDDYQARHRRHFVDSGGSWIAPAVLTSANRFWDVIATALRERRVHLLVVTRSDTAAGLACVRFLGEDQVVSRTLPRVEIDYLRPLLAGIAPEDIEPSVVSNPTGGWHELRQRLEQDLKAEGAILMQQVRTVLLGLRQLPLLTPRCYRAAGGLRGVETLVVSRAVSRAGSAEGRGETGVRLVRQVLAALIFPSGPNQPPKAKRASFSDLCNIVGGSRRAETLLRMLQHDEIVRPADATNEAIAWQLDHDYLARAVLADARVADRWALALREGRTRHQDADNWRRRWTTLLPVSTLVRVCWERARGRLTLGEATGYAWLSAMKPVTVLLGLLLLSVTTYVSNEDRLLTREASGLIDKFGGESEKSAVLSVWGAPEPVRQHVYDLLGASHDRLQRAMSAGWYLAHAGLESSRQRQVLAILHSSRDLDLTLNSYLTIAPRLTDPAALNDEAAALRLRLENATKDSATLVAVTYAAFEARVTDPTALKDATGALRFRLETEETDATALLEAYVATAARLTDPVTVEEEAIALRLQLEKASLPTAVALLANAYMAVASRLTNQRVVKNEVLAVRRSLEKESDEFRKTGMTMVYGVIAARLTDAAALKDAAMALRARLDDETNDYGARARAKAYAGVAVRLTDPVALNGEATALRVHLEQKKRIDADRELPFRIAYAIIAAQMNDSAAVTEAAKYLRGVLDDDTSQFSDIDFVEVYAAVVARLTDPAAIKNEATSLRVRLGNHNDRGSARLATAYAAVIARLTDQAFVKDEASALRGQLEKEKTYSAPTSLATAYAAAAARLTDLAMVEDEAAALRMRLETERSDSAIAGTLATAYAAVAVRLNDLSSVKEAAADLRLRLEKTTNSETVASLAKAYGVLAGGLFEHSDRKDRSRLALEILALAGHPFLTDARDLLTALRPASGQDFGNDLGAAVRWAEHAYGIRAAQLRPSAVHHELLRVPY